jgi:uncharacterized protein involved in outer membrane biogenesis
MGKIKIIGGLIVVLSAAVIAFLLWLDPNAYKEPISQLARAITGRQLELAGDVRLRIGFTPSVTIDKVRFANAPWGSRPHMVRLDRLTAELELWPLLFGEIKISRIVVTGADILLEKDSNGRGNWLFQEPAATTQAPETDAGAPVLPTVLLVVIEKSRLIYRERPGGKMVTVTLDRLEARSQGRQSPLRLSLDGAYNGQPFSIEGTLGALARLSGPDPWPLDIKAVAGGATVTVKGTVAEPLVGDGVKITVSAAGKDLSGLSGLAGTRLPAIGPYKLDASLWKNGKTLAIKDLKLDLGSSRLRGDISVNPGAEPPRITASLTAPLLDLADFTESSKGEGVRPTTGSGRLFSAQRLPLDALRAVAGDVDLQRRPHQGGRACVHRDRLPSGSR